MNKPFTHLFHYSFMIYKKVHKLYTFSGCLNPLGLNEVSKLCDTIWKREINVIFKNLDVHE